MSAVPELNFHFGDRNQSVAGMQSGIIDSLRRDHVNTKRVMAVSGQELDKLAAGEEVDYEVLVDVFRYFTEYADVHHHPLEEIVFARLQGRDPAHDAAIAPISRQHELLTAASRRLREVLEGVEDAAIVRLDQLLESARTYLSRLQAHMDVEEQELFPLAERLLTEQDWHEIAAEFDSIPDPLFDPARAREYRSLLARIPG